MRVAELLTIASTFEEIKNRPDSRWQQLWNSGNPVIMVGTATCGRAAGALTFIDSSRRQIGVNVGGDSSAV